MRLLVWNCRSGFASKFQHMLDLAPDIAIVAECASIEILRRGAPELAPTQALRVGANPHKGLAVFSFGSYGLDLDAAYDPAITYALPVRVRGPASFNLLAVWAHYGFAPLRMSTRGPTLLALAKYRRFLREGPTVLAGDLNNHVRWDKPGKAWNHRTTVTTCGRLGLVSAYHAFEGVAHGAERHATFYTHTRSPQGPSYHIDYVFVPRAKLGSLRSVTIGSRSAWVETGLSDHVPMIVDLDLPLSDTPQPDRSDESARCRQESAASVAAQ